jgi:hypothetical protein
VLNAPASVTDAFLWSTTCVSSTQLNMPIGNRVSLHFEKPKLKEVFLSEMNAVLTWK